jgi:hypothetical protein
VNNDKLIRLLKILSSVTDCYLIDYRVSMLECITNTSLVKTLLDITEAPRVEKMAHFEIANVLFRVCHSNQALLRQAAASGGFEYFLHFHINFPQFRSISSIPLYELCFYAETRGLLIQKYGVKKLIDLYFELFRESQGEDEIQASFLEALLICGKTNFEEVEDIFLEGSNFDAIIEHFRSVDFVFSRAFNKTASLVNEMAMISRKLASGMSKTRIVETALDRLKELADGFTRRELMTLLRRLYQAAEFPVKEKMVCRQFYLLKFQRTHPVSRLSS